jgi:hypothetical protein
MSEQELQELLEAMERVRAEHASTPEKARRFLQQEGLITETGELAEPYRPTT